MGEEGPVLVVSAEQVLRSLVELVLRRRFPRVMCVDAAPIAVETRLVARRYGAAVAIVVREEDLCIVPMLAAEVPVVVVLGASLRTPEETLVALGATHVLRIPLDVATLVSRVTRCMRTQPRRISEVRARVDAPLATGPRTQDDVTRPLELPERRRK